VAKVQVAPTPRTNSDLGGVSVSTEEGDVGNRNCFTLAVLNR
jgi:hypothetical protein